MFKKGQNYSTQYSRVVPHHSTDWAITSLTSEIGRDPVLPSVYGRSCIYKKIKNDKGSSYWVIEVIDVVNYCDWALFFYLFLIHFDWWLVHSLQWIDWLKWIQKSFFIGTFSTQIK